MWLERFNLRDDDFVKIRAALLDTFDLDSGKRQCFDDLGYRLREGQQFLQPIERQFHLANWAKNR